MAFLGGVATEAKFSNLKDGITVSNGNIEDGSSNVIYDSSNSHVPTTILQDDSVTISTGNGISGGGTPTLGSSTSLSISVSDFAGGGLQDDGTGDIELINTDISVTGSNGLSGGTASLGGSVSVGISGNLSLDSDLQAVDGETIWSETNTHVPESALETLSNSALTNSSISIDGNSVNLGGSISLSTTGLALGDDEKGTFGNNNDFSIEYDSSTNQLVISDNNVDLIRQPKAGPTQFIQGADIGSIESPEDSFTQIVNASVTSALSSGDTVGYTLALDNRSIIEINGEADGAGGIQNTNVTLNKRLNLDGNGINFDDPSNSNGASGATNVGFIDFQNEEFNNTPENSSTMAYDASEGFLFNDDIELTGSLNEGAAL